MQYQALLITLFAAVAAANSVVTRVTVHVTSGKVTGYGVRLQNEDVTDCVGSVTGGTTITVSATNLFSRLLIHLSDGYRALVTWTTIALRTSPSPPPKMKLALTWMGKFS